MKELEGKTPDQIREVIFSEFPWLNEILTEVNKMDHYSEGEVFISKRAGKINKIQFKVGKIWLADKR